MNRWALVPLRLVVGFGFVAHGYAKLARGPAHFGEILAALGVPLPAVMAWVTTIVELAGGLAIMVGFATAVVAVPLAITMLTAMITVHWQYGFSAIKLKAVGEFGKPGYELNLLYIAALFALSAARHRAVEVSAPPGLPAR
ncbi:MAG: DoxX family protein [Kofleriaceae bacterium]